MIFFFFFFGCTVARKVRPGKKQIVWCSDKTGGMGGREIKLKELKHEGHIALGK
jgi:hypothetical protein